MDISLTYGGQTATLRLNQDILNLDNWARSKEYCWNFPYKNNGLADPFANVFLKRWRDMQAPAHAFLEQIRGIALPGLPRVLGLGQEGKDWIYVFEHLPDTYLQLYDLLDLSAVAHSWLGASVMLVIVNQAAQTFAALEPYSHVFTDYSTKNMMVDISTLRFAFIDLDSAWPQHLLVEKKGRSIPGQFGIHFWTLWREYMREHLWNSRRATELLPRSMVFSFAAVWGHALGLLANPQLAEAQDLLEKRSAVDMWDFVKKQRAL